MASKTTTPDSATPDQPLRGLRLLLTRPAQSAEGWAKKLRDLGARVWLQPMMAIAPLPLARLEPTLRQLARYQWILFTSRHGVDAFFEALSQQPPALHSLEHLRFGAVGAATAQALRVHGHEPSVIPEEPNAAALAERLRPQVAGQRVLFVRGEQSRGDLDRLLGPVCTFTSTPFYRQIAQTAWEGEVKARLERGAMDYVLLSSGNLARTFLASLTEAMWSALAAGQVSLVAISSQTAAPLRSVEPPPAVEPGRTLRWLVASKTTFEGMVEAMIADRRSG